MGGFPSEAVIKAEPRRTGYAHRSDAEVIVDAIALEAEACLRKQAMCLGSKLRYVVSADLGVGVAGGQMGNLVKRTADGLAFGIVAQQVEGTREIAERARPRSGKGYTLPGLGKGDACRESAETATYYYSIERHLSEELGVRSEE